jgi:ATP/maltotriose-dependent transcriptional regulator MalT
VGPEIEIMSGSTAWRVPLSEARITLGKATENGIAVDDTTVSHMHAVLERFEAGWCINDLGSSNGTWLNGERVWSQHRLRDGDEIRLGQTRMVFRDRDARYPPTEVEDAPPTLTAREHDILVSLCRPLLARDMFTQPASTRAIADERSVSEAAVKQHLGNLYAKFGIQPEDQHRRVRLANDAIRRGAVSVADLREPEEA